MHLPALENWEDSFTSLHQAAQVVGGIKKVSVEPLQNYAHLGLYVTQEGLTSGHLLDGGELILNLLESSIVYVSPQADRYVISLHNQTQASLRDAVLSAMKEGGQEVNPKADEINGQEPLTVDADTAIEYQKALYRIYTAMARFRARLLGTLSPMIVFPHGFDLSFLWFKRGSEEKTDPHMNFGFSPGSAGIPRPYIYIYASPMPDTFFDIELPSLAQFIRDPWKGIVIDYDTLVSESDAEARLEQILVDIQSAVAPLLV
jgi:hypothetical protein